MSENQVITAVCERMQAKFSNSKMVFQIYKNSEAKKAPYCNVFQTTTHGLLLRQALI